MSDADLRYPKWQDSLLQAVMEINPNKLIERIRIAETAIFTRRAEIADRTSSDEESMALRDGTSTLQTLKRIALTRSHGL